jgi:Rrf2 family protein
MRLLSKTCIYGIRAAVYLASLESEKTYVPIRQISEYLQLSFHFLTKIFQILTNHNIINSYRGPNGGVSLARPASEIKLMDIVVAIEGEGFFKDCILALPNCGEEQPCPLHKYWGETRDSLKAIFEDTNLAELKDRLETEGLRLVQEYPSVSDRKPI